MRQSFGGRLTVSFLVVALLMIALVGCGTGSGDTTGTGGTGSSGSSGVTGDEKKVLRIVVLDYNDQTMGFFQQVADDYMAAQGNVEIKLESLSWGMAHDQFVNWTASGQVPDAAMFGPKWIPEFRELDALEPFDNYLDAAFLDNFSDSLLEQLTLDGKLWSLPMALSTRVMLYRKDLFEQAGVQVPRTWDEMVEAAGKLHDSNGPYGFLVQAAGDETIWYYMYFLLGAGGSFLDADGRFKVDNAAAIEALQFETDLVNKWAVTQPNPTAAERDTVEQLFADGKGAMMWGAPWSYAAVESKDPELAKQIGVADYPTKNGTPAPLFIQDSFVMFKGSKHKQETVEFLKLFLQDEYHIPFSQDQGVLPATISAGEDPFWADNPIYARFIESLPYSQSYPVAPHWEAVNEHVRQAVQAALLGTDPAAALKSAQDRVRAISER